MTTYELAGGDNGAYGPVFGPVQATEVRTVAAGQQEYLLLRLISPVQYQEDIIEYFVVSPRYTGDSIDKLRQEGCTVGVGRVLPGKEKEIAINGVTSANVDYWSIGTCKPVNT